MYYFLKIFSGVLPSYFVSFFINSFHRVVYISYFKVYKIKLFLYFCLHILKRTRIAEFICFSYSISSVTTGPCFSSADVFLLCFLSIS